MLGTVQIKTFVRKCQQHFPVLSPYSSPPTNLFEDRHQNQNLFSDQQFKFTYIFNDLFHNKSCPTHENSDLLDLRLLYFLINSLICCHVSFIRHSIPGERAAVRCENSALCGTDLHSYV